MVELYDAEIQVAVDDYRDAMVNLSTSAKVDQIRADFLRALTTISQRAFNDGVERSASFADRQRNVRVHCDDLPDQIRQLKMLP